MQKQQKRLTEAANTLQQESEIIKQRMEVLNNILPLKYPQSVMIILSNILPVHQNHFFNKFVKIIANGRGRWMAAGVKISFIKALLNHLDPYCFPILDQMPIKIALKDLKKFCDKEDAEYQEIANFTGISFPPFNHFDDLKKNLNKLTEEIRKDLKQQQFQTYIAMKTSEFEKIQHKDILREGIFKFVKPKQELFLFDNNRIYKGTVKNDNIHIRDKGIQETKCDNGLHQLFIGNFKNNNVYNGFINIFEPPHYVYKGGMLEGEYSGFGRYISKDGKIEYNGHFENSMRSGKGKLTINKALLAEPEEIVYIGEFKNDMKHGYGVEMIDIDKKETHGRWHQNKQCYTIVIGNKDVWKSKKELVESAMISPEFIKDTQQTTKYIGFGSNTTTIGPNQNYSSPYQNNNVNNNQQSQKKFAPKEEKQEEQKKQKKCSIF